MLTAELRKTLNHAIEEKYKTEGDCCYPSPWLIDFDAVAGFIVAELKLDDEWCTYKLTYAIDEDAEDPDQSVTLGEPVALEQRYVLKGTTTVVASKIVVGDPAQAMLAEVIAGNPTYAGILDTPNASPFVIDLTLLDTKSQHLGTKFVLKASGAEASTKTLAGKPVHMTAGFMGHVESGRPWKPIGVTLGGKVMDDKIVRVAGLLWEQDFPDEVQQIRASKALLGASWEIQYPKAKATRLDDETIEVAEWTYTGSAILLKNAAAYPDTALLHADNKTPRHTPPARRPAPTSTLGSGGNKAITDGTPKRKVARAMAGRFAAYQLPDGTDESVIAQIVKDEIAELQAGKELEGLRVQVAEMTEEMKQHKFKKKAEEDASIATLKETEARAAAAETTVDELTAQVAEHATKLAEITTRAETLEAEKVAAELKIKSASWWKAFAEKNGLTNLAVAEIDKRWPLIEKAAKGEGLTVDEWSALQVGGARTGTPAHAPQQRQAGAKPVPIEIPLAAGAEDSGYAMADQGTLRKSLPALDKAINGKPTIR